jgi:Ca2+-binding EF-hand superfamily protein
MMGATVFLVVGLTAAAWQDARGVPAAAEKDGARHLILLAENRPIFVRLRITAGDRPFEAAWLDSVRLLHASLDRNGDGTLTAKEADSKVITALVRLAMGPAATVPALFEADVRPKDGKVSVEELAESLEPLLGPFRLQVGRQGVGRTDALFEHLDRDKDEQLTRPELAAIAGSLRPLDLDDDEMISAFELEPYNSPALSAMTEDSSGRQSRFTALPPAVELIPNESSLRSARLLLKKYDKGRGEGGAAGRPDNKLSLAEFAIDPDAFAGADTNGDGALDTDELRKFLARAPVDLTLDVALAAETSGRSTSRVEAGGALPKGTQVRRLADGDVEFAIGQVRLDAHLEDGNGAQAEVRRLIELQFKAADANKDGYLEGKELVVINAPQSPIAGLSEVIDRDADGKIYLKELYAFIDRQQAAAQSRLIVTTADQGRAIFGIVDRDRDRRLGARELLRTVDRVMTWDSDGDGRVTPDEIPYHLQVTIARSGLAGLTGERGVIAGLTQAIVASRVAAGAAGPEWFQKMDRNYDGDVSRREFLGTRDQFNRLDRDKDGLIDAEEARAAGSVKDK